MNALRVNFCNFWPEWDIEDFITPILSKHYNIIIDKKNPDILFHSIFDRMNQVHLYKCKKVLILAENFRPSQFGSDFSISFDPETENNYKLPLWQIYLLLKPELKDILFNREKRDNIEFERFCAFSVSNPTTDIRNNFFDMLNNYKKVHSYGKVRMNDFGLKKASQGKYWRDAKYDFFIEHSHKFMMAFENNLSSYYCTEKIMDAYLGKSIPIYWGDPKVEENWNKDSFINVNKLGSSWVDLVKKLDIDDKLYLEMYNQPTFTELQKKIHIESLDKFEDWLIKITSR